MTTSRIFAVAVLTIATGTPHAVKNVGSGKTVELATYTIKKGKPLFAQVK